MDWFLCCSCNPQTKVTANHLNCMCRSLHFALRQYENFTLMRSFNIEPTDLTLQNFHQFNGCKNIFKDKICFKSPINPPSTDLIITNRLKSFQGVLQEIFELDLEINELRVYQISSCELSSCLIPISTL